MELCLVVEHACNLRCSYCYTGHKAARPMSKATAERAIDFALERRPRELTLSFFGGEPLLQMELLEHATAYAKARLAETCPSAPLLVGLNTNATLIDEAVLRFVRSQPTYAYVSLDGPALVHDRHRLTEEGRGSHGAAKDGLLRLVGAGVTVGAVGVLNPDTAGDGRAIATELLSLPVDRVVLACNLRARWDEPALIALRHGLREATEPWKQAFREGRAQRFEPFASKILSHLHAGMPCAGRCQLLAHDLTVAPSGRLYTCGERVQADEDLTYCIGSLDSGIDQAKLERLRADKSQIEEHCRDCELLDRCSSSCGCKHVALTGRYGAVTSTLCDTEAAFVEAADEVAEALYAEGCEAFLQYFYRRPWAPMPSNGIVQIRRKDVVSQLEQA